MRFRASMTMAMWVLGALGAPAPLCAQDVLYVNAPSAGGGLPLATGAKARSGGRAPTGTQWSELQSPDKVIANAIAGVAVHDGVTGGAFRIADRFTVPPGQVWRITGVRVYAYQPGELGQTGPADGFNFQILTGPPGDEGALTLHGDTTTNRLGTSVFAGLYRAMSTVIKAGRPALITDRPIWQFDSAPVDMLVPAGEYWLDWQLSSADPDRALFAPTATVLSSRGESLGTDGAMHLAPGTPAAAWSMIEDPGIGPASRAVAQRVPFVLMGEPVPSSLADIALLSGEPGQDGAVDETDLITFFRAYMDSDPLADVCGAEGAGSAPDGLVTSADLVAFVSAYAVGIE